MFHPLHFSFLALIRLLLFMNYQELVLNFLFYLPIWLCRALVAACRIFAGAHGLLTAARGLNYPPAHGILVPWPGIKPESPELEGQPLNHQGSPINKYWRCDNTILAFSRGLLKRETTVIRTSISNCKDFERHIILRGPGLKITACSWPTTSAS